MNTFKIIFPSESLHRSKSGSITGRVVVKVGDFLFPGEGWSDFVVVILGWWLQEFHKLDGQPKNEAIFRFMDGPYEIRIRNADNQAATITCVEHRRVVIERHSATVSIAEIHAELLRVSKELGVACDSHGWTSGDIETLRREIASLL